jgi:hypothetical protein
MFNRIDYQEIEPTLHNMNRNEIFAEIYRLLISCQEYTANGRKGGGFLMGGGKKIVSQFTNRIE